jgi:tRNA G37 N-methylase TrmD
MNSNNKTLKLNQYTAAAEYQPEKTPATAVVGDHQAEWQ